MASQNNNNNNNIQKPLNQKEVTHLLFREEIQNPTEESSFEGSQEETNIFNEVFSGNDPSLFEQSRIKLQNNMVMCRIVESSGRGIFCYNICCILPDKKEVSHDKTDTRTAGTKGVSHDKTGTSTGSTGTGTKEVSHDKTSTITGTKEISHDKTGTITGMKEISHDQTGTITGTGMKEVFQDKAGISTGTGTKEVSQDKTGIVLALLTKPAAPSQMKLETVNKNNKIDESGTSRIVPVPPVSSHKEPKMANQIGTKLDSVGSKLISEETNRSIPVLNTPVSSQTVNQNPNKETHNFRRRLLKDLCTDLRANANRLLADSGYKMELRKIKGKNCSNHVYHLPNNKGVLQNLPKTWVSLGNLLNSDRTGTTGKQWVGIEDFKSDLQNILIYIENTMKNNIPELSLLHRWFLLDPFVAVTFIDQKIGALKKGIKIRAINSKTSIISENEIMDLKNKNVNSCEKTLLPLVISQSECRSGKEVQNVENLDEIEIPIGSEFAITQVSQDTLFQKPALSQKTVFQKPVLSQNTVFQKPILNPNTVFQEPILSQNTVFQKPVLNQNAVFQKAVWSQNTVFQEPVPSLKDLCTHLRASANGLLADSGYKLDLRKKKGRNYLRPVYQLPNNGPVLQNLPKAWVSLGNFLNSDRTSTSTSTITSRAGNQWVGIEEYKSDLRNTLIFIESMKNNNYELSLLDRWFLLDPFVAVTFIDQKIGALRKGVRIKAIDSKTSFNSENEIMVLKNKDGNQCEKTLLPLVMSQSESQYGKVVQNAVNLNEHSVINSETSVISENEIMNLKNKNVNQCENTLLALMTSQSESRSEQEVQLLLKNELPIGSKFAINQVKQSTGTPNPVLILFPSDVQLSLDGEGQVTVNKMGNEIPDFQPGNEIPVFKPTFFQGTLAFDKTSGFEMKESFINWVVYNHVKSKSKNKRKSNSDSKENRPQKKLKEITDTSEKKRVCPFNSQDLLISAIVMKRASKYLKKPKIPSLNNQTVKEPSKRKRFSKGPRTILKLLINRGLVSVNCKIFYTNSKLVKGGKLTRKGILCECCNELFPISGFKRHTDFDAEPGLMNLFVGFGKPYVICLFKAWESEYKEMRERVMKVTERKGEIERNDDACGLCADVGELVCCDSCPASFHESCLPDQNVPEESWNCPRCKCGICGDFIGKSMEKSSSNGFLACFQCGNKYHEKCRKDKRVVLNEDGPLNTWFCENECHQVYTYMRFQVGKSIPINNGLYFTTLRCDHEETKKNLNSEELAMLAENNMKLAVACRVMEECFDKIVDLRTGVDLIPLVMYNWRVENVNLDCTGFYTVVLEKDDRIISVASIRLHGTKAAEMPLIATCIENRKQGMCRHLVSTIQQMLKYLNVETLIISAVPNLVETWISHFGFIPIKETDKEMLCKLNLLTIPNTVLLKKNLHQVPDDSQGEGCSYYTSSQNQLKKVGSQEVEKNPGLTRN